MTSSNEELSLHPRKKVSPFEFRNTDLVSRLLAATPTYFYNMPLAPNSYFFSEMLRSFVQAKSESSTRTHTSFRPRRSRKRFWEQSRTGHYQKDSTCSENSSSIWKVKPQVYIEDNKDPDCSMELSMYRDSNMNNNKLIDTNIKEEPNNSNIGQILENETISLEKQNMSSSSANDKLKVCPNLIQNLSQDTHSSNLILPPPPPTWYPSLYPTPYGIDPLHFFIDLRVSGHIYDRKNLKETSPTDKLPTPINQPCVLPSLQMQNIPDGQVSSNNKPYISDDIFKQSRHSSAFSVPVPPITKNLPINLSSDNLNQSSESRVHKILNFDIKSMGFDKSSSNSTSLNYILANIENIYKKLYIEDNKHINNNREYNMCDKTPSEESKEVDLKETPNVENESQSKDLRAVIGLELVVDYMTHGKPEEKTNDSTIEACSTNIESVKSPDVEVVATNEDVSFSSIY